MVNCLLRCRVKDHDCRSVWWQQLNKNSAGLGACIHEDLTSSVSSSTSSNRVLLQKPDFHPCLTGEHGCHRYATCNVNAESYTCTCKAGFQGSGFNCQNINECASTAIDCGRHGRCKDTFGSYKCVCDKGFKNQNFSCVNRNECAENIDDCNKHAKCLDTEGSFTCTCKPGWSGDGRSCVNVNECLQETSGCHLQADCLDSPGSYKCACKRGFIGDGRECRYEIHPCTSGEHNCHKHAYCHKEPASYTCTCKKGFQGDGLTCQNINECTANSIDCGQHGTCEDTIGSYKCVCLKGFKSQNFFCVNRNECAESKHDCDVNAACSDTEGSFVCSCKSGWTGDGKTCINVNECVEQDPACHQEADCVDNPGSYKCVCKTGFTGDGLMCRYDFGIRFTTRSTQSPSVTKMVNSHDSSTVCMWMRPAASGTIVSTTYNPDTTRCQAPMIQVTSSGIRAYRDTQLIQLDYPVRQNWTHVCAVWQASLLSGEQKLYVNSLPTHTSSLILLSTVPVSEMSVFLGNEASLDFEGTCDIRSPENGFLGEIRDFFAWTTALSAEHIALIYTKNQIPKTKLVIDWNEFRGSPLAYEDEEEEEDEEEGGPIRVG